MWKNYLLIIIACFGFSNHALAKTNPLLWSIEKNTVPNNFPPVTQLGQLYQATYVIQNNLPNAIPLSVTASSGSDFNVNNGCNKTLSLGEKCTVVITFKPSSAGIQTLQLTAFIPGRKYLLPSLSAQTGPLFGSTALTLPASSYRYVKNTTQFVFTNTSQSTVIISTVGFGISVDNIPTNNPWLTLGEDTCSGHSLEKNSSCSVSATLTPTMTGDVKLTAYLNYLHGGDYYTASIFTPTTVMNPPPAVHTVTFVNQCPFNVWYGITQNGGTAVDPTPAAAGGANYLLAAAVPDQPAASTSLQFTQYIGGAIYPRTGCTYLPTSNPAFHCVTGDGPAAINATTGAYEVGKGPVTPISKIELTMTSNSNTDGVYDVSLVDGLSIPASIQGIGPTTSSNPFQCATMGSTIQSGTPPSSLGVCPWQIPSTTPGNVNPVYPLVSVGSNPTTCASDGACTAGQVCGLGYSGTTNEYTWSIQRVCGQLVGYWNANAICEATTPWTSSTVQQQMYTAYSCSNSITPPIIPTPVYSCTGTYLQNNCYNSNAPNTCCGCVNWNNATNIIPVAPNPLPFSTFQGNSDGSTKNCVNSNQNWINLGYPAAYQFKSACPTAYSFPDDDKSAGGAECNQETPGNLTSYQITFCPGGKTAGACPSGHCS